MSFFLTEETCRCDLPLRVLTSWTPTNPSRRFVVCANRSKPGKKKCGYWEWNLLHNEINCQARIEELEGELFENGAQLRRCEASLTFWKSTFLAFVI
ncbi:DNA-(apurinic or apyrimidinic site) lyase 2 [Tanacetum coccineum]